MALSRENRQTMFHSNLKYLRQINNDTQKKLSEKIGADSKAVYFYEQSREPSYEKLVKIAIAYNTSVDYLLGKTNDRCPYTNYYDNNFHEPEFPDAFNKSLKEIRNSRNLSQAALSEKVGLSIQSISKYENTSNTPCFKHLIEISDALDCKVDQLLGISPENSIKENDKNDLKYIQENITDFSEFVKLHRLIRDKFEIRHSFELTLKAYISYAEKLDKGDE